MVFCCNVQGTQLQGTDTLNQVLGSEDIVQPNGHIRQWQSVLNLWSGKLDSVKRKLSWVRNQADKAFIDSTLIFFTTARTEMLALGKSVKAAQLSEEVNRKKDQVTDTTGVLEITVADSLKLQVPQLLDTLRRMESGINRLVLDVEYLQRTTIHRREELAAIQATPTAQRPSREQVLKTMEKNWVKDGASTSYFAISTWGNRLFILLISLFYFYWIFRLGRKTPEHVDELTLHKNEPLWIPILKALLLFLVLLPITSLTVPIVVLEISYLIIFILLCLILYSELSVMKRRIMLFTFAYYIAMLLANLLLSDEHWTKLLALTVNLVGVYLLWRIGQRTDLKNPIGYLPGYARMAIALAHALAILFLVLGYLDMGRMWSLIAAIGMLQGLSLRAIRDMLLHDLQKQYQLSKEDSWFRRFDPKQMLATVDRIIRFCFAILVLLVLFNGLHLTREVATVFDRIFNSSHRLGSINFSYGDLFLAVVVVAASNWLQKTLKRIIDIPNGSEKHMQKMTLFPLFRLAIIVVGFLIGISILGLGMDKLTVIIGALSVGIGLGLQNIINNFVSGIILVFEKPFKIGDYVELADKKGQVMEVGIRSSTLLTDQGARVIIPNGDLLSGRLVNWTFSDSDIRLNMQLIVDKSVELNEWKAWLRTKIKSFEEVDRAIPIKIWTQGMTADSYQISIQVGIRNVQLIEKFRSNFLEIIQREMETKQIRIASG